MNTMIPTLTKKSGLSEHSVQNILKLLEQGATVPFIARYRKEMTGGATDEQLRDFEEERKALLRLSERKQEILRLIEERGFLTDAIRRQVEEAPTPGVLEDVYRPYKEKKSTRAGVAVARGLEPLADILQNRDLTIEEIREEARRFTGKDVPTPEEAITGAQDILADRYSDNAREREYIRKMMRSYGLLEVKPGKKLDPKGVYKRYGEHSERVSAIPSHRYLAIMRGVREKQLSVKISIDTGRIIRGIRNGVNRRKSAVELLVKAYEDGLKRLLLPSIEREIHNELKERSDRQAVHTFGKNLEQLLMTPPVTGMIILGVDPAYRTGCKCAVIDENGTFLAHDVIYPTPPRNDIAGAKATVLRLVGEYGITGVAVGNGTASRETQAFLGSLIREENLPVKYTVVSEAGASVYSASETGRREYPDLDVTVRGAISIAQRLRDPMAALVKIDPQSLGIGQYQHDVDEKMLERKLTEVIEDCVNRVGVEINSASVSLLSYLAGVGPKAAERIVAYRESHGPFRKRRTSLRSRGSGRKYSSSVPALSAYGTAGASWITPVYILKATAPLKPSSKPVKSGESIYAARPGNSASARKPSRTS